MLAGESAQTCKMLRNSFEVQFGPISYVFVIRRSGSRMRLRYRAALYLTDDKAKATHNKVLLLGSRIDQKSYAVV